MDRKQGFYLIAQGIKMLLGRVTNQQTNASATVAETLPTEFPTEFPKVPTTNKRTTTRAEEANEAAELFRQVSAYLHSHRIVRRNMVTGLMEWADLSDPKQTFVVVDKDQLTTLSTLMLRDGIKCGFSLFQRICQADIYPHYDPLVDFMNRLPEWDGHDHVGDLIHRVTREAHAEEGMRMWLRAIAAKMMHHDEEHPWANMLMPILVGAQGLRKTTFTRMILPIEGFFSQNIDFSPKGDWPKKLTRYILVNDDEFDRHGDSQLATMKSAISTSQVMTRIPYSRQEKAFTRLAAMIGTSNQLSLLRDDTGSRRFLVINVTQVIDTETPVPYEQLYAQLRHDLEQGEPYYPSKGFERVNEKHNALYCETNVVEEYFYKHFSFAHKGEEGAQWLTTTDIFDRLCKAHPTLKKEVTNAKVFGRKLRTIVSKEVERSSLDIKTITHHGESGTSYCVVPKLTSKSA